MAQFPVSDGQGVLDGLNYVLSGPGSIGQDLAGFNSDITGDLTGNYRVPFTQYNGNILPNVSLYVAPIALSTSEMLDSRTWKFTFLIPFVQPPFINGQPINVTGVTDPSYDGYYSPIGVVECTGAYVIARSIDEYPLVAPSTGGTVDLNSNDTTISTDCNAKVTVNGAQDRVVVNAQLNNLIYTDPSRYPGSFYYTVQINRYIAETSTVPGNLGSVFFFDKTVVSKQILVNTPIAGVTNDVETLFISVVDQPGLGQTTFKGAYYWYILEIIFNDNAGSQLLTNSVLGLRSFSAQVVKP